MYMQHMHVQEAKNKPHKMMATKTIQSNFTPKLLCVIPLLHCSKHNH